MIIIIILLIIIVMIITPRGLEVPGGIWHGISSPLAARLKCTYLFNENKKQIIPPRPSRGSTTDASPREKPAWD